MRYPKWPRRAPHWITWSAVIPLEVLPRHVVWVRRRDPFKLCDVLGVGLERLPHEIGLLPAAPWPNCPHFVPDVHAAVAAMVEVVGGRRPWRRDQKLLLYRHDSAGARIPLLPKTMLHAEHQVHGVLRTREAVGQRPQEALAGRVGEQEAHLADHLVREAVAEGRRERLDSLLRLEAEAWAGARDADERVGCVALAIALRHPRLADNGEGDLECGVVRYRHPFAPLCRGSFQAAECTLDDAVWALENNYYTLLHRDLHRREQ